MDQPKLASFLVGMALWAAALGLAAVVSGRLPAGSDEVLSSESLVSRPPLVRDDEWPDYDGDPIRPRPKVPLPPD